MATEETAKVRRGDQPATLRDVLVVLCLLLGFIGLLRACSLNFFMEPDPNARLYTTKASIDKLTAAIEKYHRDCGQWPSEAQGLTVLLTNAEAVAGWKGPYVSSEGWTYDSWGNSFRIMADGQKRVIVSAGPDGEFGTRDDIKGDVLSDKHKR